MTVFSKARLFAATAAMSTLVCAPALAQDLHAFTPNQVQAMAKDSNSIKGAKMATLLSHDGGEVVATNIWLPAHSDIQPHSEIEEGSAAVALVLTDGLELAMGDKFDASKLESVPAGTAVVLTHDNAKRFARTGDKPVQIMLLKSFATDFAKPLGVQK